MKARILRGLPRLHDGAVDLALKLAACSCISLLSTGALGQVLSTPPSPAADASQRVEITGTGQANDDRAHSITTKITITREELTRFGETNLADALKRQPGITVSKESGRPPEVRLRGLGEGYTLILVDGQQAPPGFSLDTLSPALIERVEIRRGATAETGSQAIAGTINIVLRKPSNKSIRQIILRSAHGSGGWSPSIEGVVGFNRGAFAGSLTGTALIARERRHVTTEEHFEDAASVPTGERVTSQRGQEALRSITLRPTTTIALGEANTLKLEGLVRASRLDSEDHDVAQTQLGPPPSFPRNDFDLRVRASTLSSKAAWTRKLGDDASIEINIGQSWFRRNTQSTLQSTDDVGVPNRDRLVRSLTVDRTAFASGKYRDPLGDAHALVLGWDSSMSTRVESRVQRERPFVGLTPQDIDEGSWTGVRRLALFAQDEWEVTRRLAVYGGIRWESLSTKTETSESPEVGHSFSVLSPTLQLQWNVPGTKKDQLRASLSRTYKAPRPAELSPRRYVSSNNSATSPDLRGNSNLAPELAWSFDATYEARFGDSGLASFGVYRRDIEGVIVNTLTNSAGIWVSSPANMGNAVVYGVEIELTGSVRQWLPAGPKLNVRASAGRHWSSVSSVPGPNNRLARQTPASASLSMDYAFPNDPVTVGAAWAYTGGGPARLSANRLDVLPYTRAFDANLTWRVTAISSLTLSVTNLLRPDTTTVNVYADEAGSLRQVGHAATDRLWRATFEQKF